MNEQAFITAAKDMNELRSRNDRLRQKLEKMYENLCTALDTPAGHAMKFESRDVLLNPIEDMGKVLDHMCNTLNIIIGYGGAEKGIYYDKLFAEYEELERILRNKVTH